MARLGTRDKKRVAEVAHAIRSLEEPSPRVLPTVLPQLCELVGAERSGAYGVRRVANGCTLEFGTFHDFAEESDEVVGRMDRHLQSKTRIGFYDPACPPPKQRDQAVIVPWRRWATDDLEERTRRLREDLPGLGVSHERLEETVQSVLSFDRDVISGSSIEAYNQLRVLVCDGVSLLAWVGAFQHESFSERQRLILANLVPALKERLIVERRLDEAMLSHAGLDAALELLSVPAFIVEAEGHLQHANRLGRGLLDRDCSGTLASLDRALRAPAGAGYLVTPLRAPGLCNHYLLTEIAPARDPAGIAAEASRFWALTKREAAVLARVARGESNKTVAGSLGCSDRTVELHVSSILHKVGLESRAQLIAELWRRFG